MIDLPLQDSDYNEIRSAVVALTGDLVACSQPLAPPITQLKGGQPSARAYGCSPSPAASTASAD